jgi:O-6-methylguanine DNA methyltransferase
VEKLKFDVMKTSWGYVAAAASRKGIRHLILPRSAKQVAFEDLCTELRGEELLPDEQHPLLTKLAAQLRNYFQGRVVEFSCKLDYNIATPFQREVWGITRTIGYGFTRHYGWIAERLGDPGSPRAVGQALGANPLPLVIPCHRVIAANGGLGGFSGGVEMKSRLLKLEGVILT